MKMRLSRTLMSGAAILVSLVASGIAVLADTESGEEATPVKEEIRQSLLGILPTKQELKAIKVIPPRIHSSDLYEYLNGGADAYHGYDMVAMVHQESEPPGLVLTIDVFDMGAPLNAFGIYAAERSPDYGSISIGAQGYADEYSLNFLQNRYYVKLSAFSQDGRSVEDGLRSIANALSANIGGSKAMPELLELLPAEKRVPCSEKYLNEAPLGHSFLEPAVTAQYNFQGKESTLLVSLADNPANAKERIEKLVAHFQRSGEVHKLHPDMPNVYAGENPYEGKALMVASGDYAVVWLSPAEDPMGFLQQLVSSLLER